MGVPAHLQSILELEKAILQLPQIELEISHDFCAGIYARTMFIPAGTILTGAIHRHECFFTVRSGDLVITTDDGPAIVGAGFSGKTEAGTKRAGIAITDCLVTTYHANPEELREPEKIWEFYAMPQDNLLEETKKVTL